jgi:hypothetical protein
VVSESAGESLGDGHPPCLTSAHPIRNGHAGPVLCSTTFRRVNAAPHFSPMPTLRLRSGDHLSRSQRYRCI